MIDTDTGQIVHRKPSASTPEIVAWVASLPGPQIATDATGPTGFGLSRRMLAAGIACQVAAQSKLLLRHGYVYDGGAAWTAWHDRWLREHRDRGDVSLTTAFDAYYEAVAQTVARRDRLDKVIEQIAADSSFAPIVNRLGCPRGVSAGSPH